jgi:hypothetical protein
MFRAARIATSLLLGLGLLGLTFALGAAAQSNYQVVSLTQAGTITGTVKWMNAEILVVSHPYYAVTDESGRFKLTDVPSGHYQIVAGTRAGSWIGRKRPLTSLPSATLGRPYFHIRKPGRNRFSWSGRRRLSSTSFWVRNSRAAFVVATKFLYAFQAIMVPKTIGK